MCLENIIGISTDCGNSKSGLYLDDLPMMSPIISKCCSDFADETQHRINTAAKLVRNELLIFSSRKLQVRQPKKYKIGYRYANHKRLNTTKYTGVVLSHRRDGDGTIINIDTIRIPTPKTRKVKLMIRDCDGKTLYSCDVMTNTEVEIGVKSEKDLTIFYPSIETQLVLDACSCKGWKAKYSKENPYYYGGRKAPDWSNDVMVGGVSFDRIDDVCNYSKELNMEIKASIGCDPSGWICLTEYDENNPLHIMIANAVLHKSASLMMQAVFSDTAISRSNLIAKEYASEAAVHLDEQYQFYIEKIIDYVETNHEQIDFCMICKSCIKKRWHHGLLK